MKKPTGQKIAPEAPGTTYQLKIELEGITPQIWRRLQVPGDARLGWLHAAILRRSTFAPPINTCAC
jgi:hypothetical protein